MNLRNLIPPVAALCLLPLIAIERADDSNAAEKPTDWQLSEGEAEIEIKLPRSSQLAPALLKISLERPLFREERAPSVLPDQQAPAPEVEPEPLETTNVQSKPEPPPLKILGFVSEANEAGALVLHQGTQDESWVGVGDLIDDWKVESIGIDIVQITNGDHEATIRFSSE